MTSENPALVVPVIAGKGDALKVATRIGTTLAKCERMRATKARQIARLEERIRLLRRNEALACEPLEAYAQQLAEKLYAYVEEHRDELTGHGKRKSVLFRNRDQVRWQPFRATRIPDEEAFFLETERLGFAEDFVRVKREPNRAALLEEANAPRVSVLTSVEIVEGTRPVIQPSRSVRRLEGVMTEDGSLAWSIVEPRKKP